MCVIIVQKKENTLTKREFRHAWDVNPDGFGMAYVKNGRIIVRKSIHLKEAYNQYVTAKKERPEAQMVLHFRIGTGSYTNLNNCHPFVINEKCVFFHNGILSNFRSVKEKSDTAQFADILRLMKNGFEKTEAGHKLLQMTAGDYSNKFVLLDNYENVTIINSQLGTYKANGDWYSNDSLEYDGYYGYNNSYTDQSYGYTWDNEKHLWRAPKTLNTTRIQDGIWREHDEKIHNHDELDWEVCDGCGKSFKPYDLKYSQDWMCHLCYSCAKEYEMPLHNFEANGREVDYE